MRGLTLRLLLALCLVASTAQGFIAQTHVHAAARSGAVASGVSIATAVVDADPSDEPLCVLCDVAGHTPAVAPPAEAGFTGLPKALLPAPSASPVFAATSVPGHHWRGRAPPTV